MWTWPQRFTKTRIATTKRFSLTRVPIIKSAFQFFSSREDGFVPARNAFSAGVAHRTTHTHLHAHLHAHLRVRVFHALLPNTNHSSMLSIRCYSCNKVYWLRTKLHGFAFCAVVPIFLPRNGQLWCTLGSKPSQRQMNSRRDATPEESSVKPVQSTMDNFAT